VHKRLWLRLRDIGFLMDAHCYYAAANEAHHLVRLYREAVLYYGGHDFTREDRFRMSLEIVPYLDEARRLTRARAPQLHSDYIDGNDEEVGHIQELLVCLEDLQHEIQRPVPRPPQHTGTHVDEKEEEEENEDALDMELYASTSSSSSLRFLKTAELLTNLFPVAHWKYFIYSGPVG
jgi:hypothetical protein